MNFITNYTNKLKETFKDNKKIIISCFVVFIILTIFSFAINSVALNPQEDSINNSKNDSTESTKGETLLFILKTNVQAVLTNYLGGIFLGILPVIILVRNSVVLGKDFVLYGFTHPLGMYRFFFSLLPHGIFELTAIILSSASGLILLKFILTTLKGLRHNEEKGIKEKLVKSYHENRHTLIQSLILLSFSLILILIAAPIETYISASFGKFIIRY